MKSNLNIGANIKYLAKQKGLSIMKIAPMLDLTYGKLSSYSRGENLPPLDIAFKIADFFEVTLEELAREDLSTYTRPDTEALKYKEIKKLEKEMEEKVEMYERRLRVYDKILEEKFGKEEQEGLK